MSNLTGLFYLQVPETYSVAAGYFADLLIESFTVDCKPYFTEPNGGVICYSTQFKTEKENPCGFFNIVPGPTAGSAYVISPKGYLVPCAADDTDQQCATTNGKYQQAQPDFAYVIVPCYPVFSLAIELQYSQFVNLIYNPANIATPWSASPGGQITKFQLLENTLWQLGSEFYKHDTVSKSDKSSAVTLEPSSCGPSGTLQMQRVALSALASLNPTDLGVDVVFPASTVPLVFKLCSSQAVNVGFDAATGSLQYSTTAPKQPVYLVPVKTPQNTVSANSADTAVLLQSLVAVSYPEFLGVNIPEVPATLTFNNSLDSPLLINGVSVAKQSTGTALTTTIPFSLALVNSTLPAAFGSPVVLSPVNTSSPVTVFFSAPYDFIPMLTYTYVGTTVSFLGVQSTILQDILIGKPGWFSTVTEPLFYDGAMSNYPVVPNVPFIFELSATGGYLSAVSEDSGTRYIFTSDLSLASASWFEPIPSQNGYFLKISTNDSSTGAFLGGSLYLDYDATSETIIGTSSTPVYKWTLWLSTGDGTQTNILFPMLVAYKDNSAMYCLTAGASTTGGTFASFVTLPTENLSVCTGVWTQGNVPNSRFLSPIESPNWNPTCNMLLQTLAQCWELSYAGCPFDGPVCTVGQTKPGSLLCPDNCAPPPESALPPGAVSGITNFLQNTCGILAPASASWPCADIAGAKSNACSGFKQSLLRFPCERYGKFADSYKYPSTVFPNLQYSSFSDILKINICNVNSPVTTPECSCLHINENSLQVPSRNNLSFNQFNCQLLNKFSDIPDSGYIDTYPTCWWPTCDPLDGGLVTNLILSSNVGQCSSNFYDCQVLFDNPSDVNFLSKLSQACQNTSAKGYNCLGKDLGESMFDTKARPSPTALTNSPAQTSPTAPAKSPVQNLKALKNSATTVPPLSPTNIALIVIASVLLAVFIAFGIYEGFLHARFLKLRTPPQ
jgi:hypothetical protein